MEWKPNRMLGMLERVGDYGDLYVSLVSPHLVYVVLAWNPHLQGNIEKIESAKEGLPEFQQVLRNLSMRRD